MKSVVCTLFEGKYHYGLVALATSLYQHGYRGPIYAGFKGSLPNWCLGAKADTSILWPNSLSYEVVEGLNIIFLPIKTISHFTNYKPEFILDVWENCVNNPQTLGIFYFDPDIINKCSWNFYEKWISYGIALVHEIVWNDMPPTHPKRYQWKTIAKGAGYEVNNNVLSLINAGFIGINRNQFAFLEMWKRLIEYSVEHYGYDKGKFSQSNLNHDLFTVGDQDLLNLTAMCTNEKLSEFGPDGMDFISGGWLMSHAVGSLKPWDYKPWKHFFLGIYPRLVDKLYWSESNRIIKIYPKSKVKFMSFQIKLFSFLSRFYGRRT